MLISSSSQAMAAMAKPGMLRDALIERRFYWRKNEVPASRQLDFARSTACVERLCSRSLGFCEFAASSAQDATGGDGSKNSVKLVLVVGATGGVGQLAVASLLEKGVKVRAMLRNFDKARSLFGDKIQMVTGDTRKPSDLSSSLFEGVTHVLCCTGTTAFPSKRWAGDNTPEQTDWLGVRNLIAAVPKTLQRFVLVSSIGVTKSDQLPWNIMNLFGVLEYKKMGEDFLRTSGIPYTIIRPGRLTDGPYTSYDLNTLLKATSGARRDVILGQGDTLVGEASRISVAEACIQAMDLECTCGQTYELNSIQGEGPGDDCSKWAKLFVSAGSDLKRL